MIPKLKGLNLKVKLKLKLKCFEGVRRTYVFRREGVLECYSSGLQRVFGLVEERLREGCSGGSQS